MIATPALELVELSVGYRTPTGTASAVSAVSFKVAEGEVFGLVGESGCGKSTLALTALGLLPANAQASGEIHIEGSAVDWSNPAVGRKLRGDRIAIVLPDPLTSLDPMFSVGSQIVETIRAHRRVSGRAAERRAVELLQQVGIADAQRRFRDPPHRFSGGMRQRVAIAIALANGPSVLVADEPTTALDVTIQAQILDLLGRLRRERQMAILLITHDLGVVAEICDRVGVMYAGQLVELGDTREIIRNPRHPYTRALLAAVPTSEHLPGELAAIAGEIPDLEVPPAGCRFAPRCPHAMPVCRREPTFIRGVENDWVACWLYAEQAERDLTSEPLEAHP
jgi:oligopeptide/dipeptide ABC transporter ATP-binding protein